MTSHYRSALRRLLPLLPTVILLLVAGRQLPAQTRPLYATTANNTNNVRKYFNGSITSIVTVNQPIAPVYDMYGNLYVINGIDNGFGAHATGSSIIRITPNGSMRLLTAAVPGASWLAVDPAGNIWVSTSVFGQPSSPLYKVTPNGAVTVVATIPKTGYSVACDALGNVYVGTTGTVDTVYKVLPNGIVQAVANSPGYGLYGMVVDSANNVYVSGGARVNGNYIYQIYKITPDGTQSTFATLARTAYGLAIDTADNLYVYDRGQAPPTILKITPAGVQSNAVTIPGAPQTLPEGIARDSQGSFAINDFALSSVRKIASDGSVTTLATGLGTPTGLAYNGFGTMYVVDNTNKSINSIAADDSVTMVASLPNAGSLQGLAYDAVGNLYVADIANNVVDKVTSGGVVSTFLSGLAAPQSLAFDSKGSLYIVNSSQILRTAPDGSNETLFAGNLTNAYGITIDSADNVFVSTTNGALYKITPAGVASSYKNLSGLGDAADYNGDLYLVTTFNISRIAPSGTVTTISNSSNNNYIAFGQGVPNLILQHQNTNQVAIWTMAGTNVLGGAFTSATPAAGYKVVGTGDFKHDGATDLVFQNQTTNQIALWYMQATTVTGGDLVSAIPGSDYKVVGVGDFNGDGYPDFVFQSQSTGQLVIWYMVGANYLGGASLPYSVAAGWNVVAVGDMDGDGRPDLVFQNQSTGRLAIWYMDNTTFLGGASLNAAPGAGWTVRGLGYIAGGVENLIFQNQSSGQIAFWYMQNTTYTGGGLVSINPSTLWKVANGH